MKYQLRNWFTFLISKLFICLKYHLQEIVHNIVQYSFNLTCKTGMQINIYHQDRVTTLQISTEKERWRVPVWRGVGKLVQSLALGDLRSNVPSLAIHRQPLSCCIHPRPTMTIIISTSSSVPPLVCLLISRIKLKMTKPGNNRKTSLSLALFGLTFIKHFDFGFDNFNTNRKCTMQLIAWVFLCIINGAICHNQWSDHQIVIYLQVWIR